MELSDAQYIIDFVEFVLEHGEFQECLQETSSNLAMNVEGIIRTHYPVKPKEEKDGDLGGELPF